MIVMLNISRRQYRLIRAHLFKQDKEQACFLLVNTYINGPVIDLCVKKVYLIKPEHWDYQSSYHLELNEKVKVRIMMMARRSDCDLIECHSHRGGGVADFSHSDEHGLDEFLQYVWWKLPGRIYGAMVWTQSDTTARVWLPKRNIPLGISEIRITRQRLKKRNVIS
jgi:hypothetical protein